MCIQSCLFLLQTLQWLPLNLETSPASSPGARSPALPFPPSCSPGARSPAIPSPPSSHLHLDPSSPALSCLRASALKVPPSAVLSPRVFAGLTPQISEGPSHYPLSQSLSIVSVLTDCFLPPIFPEGEDLSDSSAPARCVAHVCTC